MRIAIATDREYVASHFGCSPMCLVANVDDGRIQNSLVIPNLGCNLAFWADLFFRNSVTHVIAGTMGSTAESVLRGRGIAVILGVQGKIDDVVTRFCNGELQAGLQDGTKSDACCGCAG